MDVFAACLSGTWGDNCASACGECLTGTCDKASGLCKSGCKPGYKSNSLCNEDTFDSVKTEIHYVLNAIKNESLTFRSFLRGVKGFQR